MVAPLRYVNISELVGSWPIVPNFLPSGTPTFLPGTVLIKAAILGVQQETSAGYDVGTKSFHLYVDNESVWTTITFTGVGARTLDQVITDINTQVGSTVAFRDNGFLRLESPTSGGSSYLRVASASTASDVLYVLGLFPDTISKAGYLSPAGHPDPTRQVSLPGQLVLAEGEGFSTKAFNRALYQLGVNAERSEALLSRKRVASRDEIALHTYNDPATGDGYQFTGSTFVYTGDQTSPSSAELEKLFVVLDSEGREFVKEFNDFIASVTSYYHVNAETGQQQVTSLAAAFTASQPKEDIYIAPNGTGVPAELALVPLKITGYIDANNAIISPIDPTTGESIPFTAGGPGNWRTGVLYEVTTTKCVVDEVRKSSSGVRVENRLETIFTTALTSDARVDLNNRLVIPGAGFNSLSPSIDVGNTLYWSGHAVTSPFSNNGTYRVVAVIDDETLELAGEDWGPVQLNPDLYSAAPGSIWVRTDGRFWKDPFIKFKEAPDGAIPQDGVDQIRILYLGGTTIREASDDPTAFGRGLEFGQEADDTIQRAILAMVGPSVTTIDEYLHGDRRKNLEDLDYRLNFEHYAHDEAHSSDPDTELTGKHRDIRPDTIDMYPETSGQTVTIRSETGEADSAVKVGLIHEGVQVLDVWADGRIVIKDLTETADRYTEIADASIHVRSLNSTGTALYNATTTGPSTARYRASTTDGAAFFQSWSTGAGNAIHTSRADGTGEASLNALNTGTGESVVSVESDVAASRVTLNVTTSGATYLSATTASGAAYVDLNSNDGNAYVDIEATGTGNSYFRAASATGSSYGYLEATGSGQAYVWANVIGSGDSYVKSETDSGEAKLWAYSASGGDAVTYIHSMSGTAWARVYSQAGVAKVEVFGTGSHAYETISSITTGNAFLSVQADTGDAYATVEVSVAGDAYMSATTADGDSTLAAVVGTGSTNRVSSLNLESRGGLAGQSRIILASRHDADNLAVNTEYFGQSIRFISDIDSEVFTNPPQFDIGSKFGHSDSRIMAFDWIDNGNGFTQKGLRMSASGAIGFGTDALFETGSKVDLYLDGSGVSNNRTYTVAGSTMSPHFLIKAYDSESGFVYEASDADLESTSNEAAFYSIFPFNDGSTNDREWKAFKHVSEIPSKDRFTVDKYGTVCCNLDADNQSSDLSSIANSSLLDQVGLWSRGHLLVGRLDTWDGFPNPASSDYKGTQLWLMGGVSRPEAPYCIVQGAGLNTRVYHGVNCWYDETNDKWRYIDDASFAVRVLTRDSGAGSSYTMWSAAPNSTGAGASIADGTTKGIWVHGMRWQQNTGFFLLGKTGLAPDTLLHLHQHSDIVTDAILKIEQGGNADCGIHIITSHATPDPFIRFTDPSQDYVLGIDNTYGRFQITNGTTFDGISGLIVASPGVVSINKQPSSSWDLDIGSDGGDGSLRTASHMVSQANVAATTAFRSNSVTGYQFGNQAGTAAKQFYTYQSAHMFCYMSTQSNPAANWARDWVNILYRSDGRYVADISNTGSAGGTFWWLGSPLMVPQRNTNLVLNSVEVQLRFKYDYSPPDLRWYGVVDRKSWDNDGKVEVANGATSEFTTTATRTLDITTSHTMVNDNIYFVALRLEQETSPGSETYVSAWNHPQVSANMFQIIGMRLSWSAVGLAPGMSM